MTKEEIIDGLEIYTVGRLKKAKVHITVEELQKFIDEIKELQQEPCEDKYLKEINHLRKYIIKLETQIVEQETSDDAVNRQAVEEMIKAEMPERGMWEIEGDKEKETVCEVCVDLIQKLLQLPPATPRQKIGHWIDITNKNGTVIAVRCSRCKESPKHAIKSDFCPKCGAKMQEESEETDI